MPRTTKPLSHTQIDRAKPQAKEYNLVDGEGLTLRIKPNGTKSWLYSYPKPITRRRTNMSIGRYPDVSLKEAREQRRLFAQLRAKNIDPRVHREEENLRIVTGKLNTFEHTAFKWLERKRDVVTSNYADDIERSFKNHVFPALGSKPLTEITAPLAINSLAKLQDEGKNETIQRLIENMNQVMLFGVNTGLISHNPLTGIKTAFKRPQRKLMPCIHPSELPELITSIRDASITETTRLLIQWQLHTLTRPTEAAEAVWDEIDLDSQLWTIPASRMKRRKVHKIPLSSQSIAILKSLEPISGHREHLFPSRKNPRLPSHSQTANMALKRMGFANRLVAHGMRALGSTILNEKEFHSDLIEKALSHADPNEVRASYNRAEYLERRREMMQWWSDHIEQSTRSIS